MNTITVHTAHLVGIEARIIAIQISRFNPNGVLTFRGLSDPQIREVSVRVRAALAESGAPLRPPEGYLVELPPGEYRGASGFDLAVAMGILALRDGHEVPEVVYGELALSGDVRPCRGVVAVSEAASAAGRALIVAEASRHEASYGPASVILVRTLADLRDIDPEVAPALLLDLPPLDRKNDPDLADVAGLDAGRAALETAVATGKNLLLIGPVGSGKTLLARRAPGIMPDPTEIERREIARIQSAAGLPVTDARPFRAPHHTASTTAIVGGGTPVRPGEMTLAHHGVLFLDELPEMTRASVDAIKGVVQLGAALVYGGKPSSVIHMPAKPLIIGAMNLCPCGKRGASPATCACSPAVLKAYFDRVAPLAEIFELAVVLERAPVRALAKLPPMSSGPTIAKGEPSSVVRKRIETFRTATRGYHDSALAFSFETVMRTVRP